MTEEILEEEIVRIYDRDEDGNVIINKQDWQNIITHATLVFYVDTSVIS